MGTRSPFGKNWYGHVKGVGKPVDVGILPTLPNGGMPQLKLLKVVEPGFPTVPNEIRPVLLKVVDRKSVFRTRSGVPSLPFGVPDGSASTTVSACRSQSRFAPQAWSRRAYSTLTATLPRPPAKFLPTRPLMK